MTTLYMVVEGASELAFAKSVLSPHLATRDIYLQPMVVGTKRDRDGRKRRGGGDWSKWEADIRRLRRDQRAEVRITTLFDLYGLPNNFPGLAAHSSVADTRRRCDLLEHAMAEAIDDRRFIPYLQRHEFEALVLAGLPALEALLESPKDRSGLQRLKSDIGLLGPEDVDDGVSTAPAKRLQRFIPSYNPRDPTKGEGKPFYAELVTEATGLQALRDQCPRFNQWVTTLEGLGAATP